MYFHRLCEITTKPASLSSPGLIDGEYIYIYINTLGTPVTSTVSYLLTY